MLSNIYFAPICVYALCLTSSGTNSTNLVNHVSSHWALEKAMATHSSILAWRTPGKGEPRGLPSMGSHRVGHDWSDLAAAAYSLVTTDFLVKLCCTEIEPKPQNLTSTSICFYFLAAKLVEATEIEENNRMRKTRDLFKKIRDTKGKFHANMGSKRTEMVWT